MAEPELVRLVGIFRAGRCGGSLVLHLDHAADQVLFLWRECALEAVRVHHALALVRRHLLQALKGDAHRSAAVIWNVVHLLMQLLQPLLLRFWKVVKLLHAVQHALLLLRRHGIEVPQTLFELLLALRREPLKLRIALQ